MNLLPTEILAHIFSYTVWIRKLLVNNGSKKQYIYLNNTGSSKYPHLLLQNLLEYRTVCKRWNDVIKMDIVWKYIYSIIYPDSLHNGLSIEIYRILYRRNISWYEIFINRTSSTCSDNKCIEDDTDITDRGKIIISKNKTIRNTIQNTKNYDTKCQCLISAIEQLSDISSNDMNINYVLVELAHMYWIYVQENLLVYRNFTTKDNISIIIEKSFSMYEKSLQINPDHIFTLYQYGLIIHICTRENQE
jgi:hypothetical protein